MTPFLALRNVSSGRLGAFAVGESFFHKLSAQAAQAE
jgi:hypothetical protein